ncbi:hypothetical protein [Maribacter flavus]|uniref:hypothetical protein n=1 Tax=Maribacter flavus TaxID=1658664 RepID=UPI0013763D6D|nr:hypothetical protein [Maribacter flavus]
MGDRLEDGRTKIFEDKIQAEKYAKQVRSYPYPIFIRQKNKEGLAGYGVPK